MVGDGTDAVLLPGWSYVEALGATPARPGLYEWRIGEGDAFVYVGKFTRPGRPLGDYARNVTRLLRGEAYRPNDPHGFRAIHEALARAVREATPATLTILENPALEDLNRRERELIAERGTLNGQRRSRLVALVAPETPFDAAFAEARAAGARGEVPVGAAVSRAGVVVARAGNRVLELRDPTAHAEVLAIRAACAALGTERLADHEVHVTLEPCPMCAAAIGFARLRRVTFAAFDPKGGGVESGPRLYRQPTCHHAPEVVGGVRETEGAELLRAFFAARR